MNDALKLESQKLARSWMQHDAEMLRDYLVSSVEDPRINLQSILTRHFLIQSLTGDQFAPIMEQECRFSAAMNWLLNVVRQSANVEELRVIHYALQRGSDNAEGIELPRFLLQIYQALPMTRGGVTIPNYLETALTRAALQDSKIRFDNETLDVFIRIWATFLTEPSPDSQPKLSALEPACGSANDYRFIRAAGIAAQIDYHGFDICQKNVVNARTLFPDLNVSEGNIFEIASANKSFDVCYFHDLLEHLSIEGSAVAVSEICRVTRWGICAGFFNMHEIPETIAQPLDDYYWNVLSLDAVRELFLRHGFSGQIFHIGTLLAQRFGCPYTHNPNAYTFVLRAN